MSISTIYFGFRFYHCNAHYAGTGHKKSQEDLRRLEDLWRLKEDVSRKEKKQLLSLLAIILGVVIVPCIALSIYNMNRLNEYDQKFKELYKDTKHIEELKKISKDVQLLKGTLTDVKKQIDEIEIFMPNASQGIAYLKKELENMNSTDKKVKDIESSISSINATISKIVTLQQNAAETDSKVAPAIQQQKELFKEIMDSNEKMIKINTTVNVFTVSLSNATKKIRDIEPKLTIFDEAATKMEAMQTDVNTLEAEIENVRSDTSTMNLETKAAESKVSKMSTEVEQLNSDVSIYEKELKTLKKEQSEVDNKIEMSNEKTKKLENDVSDAKVRVGDLKTEVIESENKVKTIKSEIDEAASKIQKEMWFCNVSIDALNHTIANLSKEVSSNATYIEKTVPTLVSNVKTLQTLAAFPWMSVVSVVDVLLILVLIVVYLNNHHWYVEHSQNDMPQNPNGNGHERRQGNVRPQSILDRIQRVPVLDNKVCVLSFYSETMNLHKQLVQSALATSRRGNNIEIIQHLVRKHEDILNIPGARYIFVFVDFNTRNVILETKEDLGDKKITTVEAAQKIGADVFVTYMKDEESNQLHPGNLFNQKLSAFTSHPVLKELGNKQRCFSVYETFNNTQKESIVRHMQNIQFLLSVTLPVTNVDVHPSLSKSCLTDVPAVSEARAYFRKKAELNVILGILIFNLSLYTKVATLQSSTQSLLAKSKSVRDRINVKISNLVRKTESCTVSIKRNEERMTVASKKISELILSVGSIRNDFETKMKEVLSKKKSELDSVVKKLETVITDQDIIIGTIKEEMNTVKDLFEQCLTLKDDLNGNAERLRNVNMQIEKFNKDSSFYNKKTTGLVKRCTITIKN
ncbi:unnamed protein product [Mytilus edulis]|uniref:Uncharacterized protein n=1 Tax=Mytilus edulis TaxID=6550 RepID=A0A8S3U2K2_MYTED|nr:unnamed protein product [Mytilus edulis]